MLMIDDNPCLCGGNLDRRMLYEDLCMVVMGRDLYIVCLFLALQPPVGHGLLIHEISRSHTTTHHSR